MEKKELTKRIENASLELRKAMEGAAVAFSQLGQAIIKLGVILHDIEKHKRDNDC